MFSNYICFKKKKNYYRLFWSFHSNESMICASFFKYRQIVTGMQRSAEIRKVTVGFSQNNIVFFFYSVFYCFIGKYKTGIINFNLNTKWV